MSHIESSQNRYLLILVIATIIILLAVPAEVQAQVDVLPEGEQNDTLESATLLNNNVLVRGSIVENDQDWFVFTANRGDTIEIWTGADFSYGFRVLTTSYESADYGFVSVEGTNNEPVDGTYTGDLSSYTAPVTGKYFLLLFSILLKMIIAPHRIPGSILFGLMSETRSNHRTLMK